MQGRLRAAVADPAGVRARQPAALARLVEGLMLGGFAMQATQSSRPASGAEHQFSHLWDMQHHTHQGRAPSHGLKVGIGTLAVTALYECLLELPLDRTRRGSLLRGLARRKPPGCDRARERFGEGDLGAVAAREISAKHSPAGQLRQQLERLRAAWPHLAKRSCGSSSFRSRTLRQMLRAAGAATEPEQIGIARDRLRDSFWQAFFIRRRFTVLDLAVRTGALDDLPDEHLRTGRRVARRAATTSTPARGHEGIQPS